MSSWKYICWLHEVGVKDVSTVGGKNAYLGQMINQLSSQGLNLPMGFVTNTQAYKDFLKAGGLEETIRSRLKDLKNNQSSVKDISRQIRDLILKTPMPQALASEICQGYDKLSRKYKTSEVDVAVRSSATAEDLPEASFAGQFDSFLNVRGHKALLQACLRGFASLFHERAIVYREKTGFEHMKIFLCLGIQKMIRSDKAGAGVIFSIYKGAGFLDMLEISSSWGLGDNVVQGNVDCDSHLVFKPFLGKKDLIPIVKRYLGSKEIKRVYSSDQNTEDIPALQEERNSFMLKDKEVLLLSRWCRLIEESFQMPVDIEWAKDGQTGQLFVVQCRAITGKIPQKNDPIEFYTFQNSEKVILQGISIGEGIVSGKTRLITSSREIEYLNGTEILVAETANLGWLPILYRQGILGLITDFGGPNSHAAILSSEMGIPAVLGTSQATKKLGNDQEVTIQAIQGDFGKVYQGRLSYRRQSLCPSEIPKTKTLVRVNLSRGESAFRWWRIPGDGIGLASLELIIKNEIKIHPLALVYFDDLEDRPARQRIENMTRNFADKKRFFIHILGQHIAEMAASQYPKPVFVRFSNMNTSEYRNLAGGSQFESQNSIEASLQGVRRYLDSSYYQGFALEAAAVKEVRTRSGFSNVHLIVPYCQSAGEAKLMLEALKLNDLDPADPDLRVHLSCDLPVNINSFFDFAPFFNGFIIDQNQLEMPREKRTGTNTGSSTEGDLLPFSRQRLADLIQEAHWKNREVTFIPELRHCNRDFISNLVSCGLDCFSVEPVNFAACKRLLADIEKI